MGISSRPAPLRPASSRPANLRVGLAATLAITIFAAGCSSTSTPTAKVRESAGKEYFAESEYGVKASPRVSNLRTRLPRGGGRDMVGKPYKVRGKWYKPKEEPNYAKTGAASWYGDAFHGRLTANGEVYDMTHLTAAHPTMPLPSYAKVTNTANGASVIVRVNDRGPYAHNRIIDLSKRAAELLDYKHVGVAKVKVEYVGRAPLHGRDDNYLLASYHPGRSGIDRPRPGSDGLPAGVMVAMNGDTPTTKKRGLFGGFGNQTRATAPAPVVARPVVEPLAAPIAIAAASGVVAAGALTPMSAPVEPFGEVLATDPVLPAFGPAVPERPYDGLAPVMVASAKLSYADERIAAAASAFDSLSGRGFSADDVRASWKRLNGTAEAEEVAPEAYVPEAYVLAGTYASQAEAAKVAKSLSGVGAVSVRADGDAWNVELRGDGRYAPDVMAELARDKGATDAFLIRD